MPNTWFRLYNEVDSDPKVQLLPPPLFKAWVTFLCGASRNGGTLPPIKDIAYRLRVTETKAQEYLDALTAAGLFESNNGEVTPHNWSARQFQSDTSTERVKRFRNAHRNVSGNDDGTDRGNVPVTPPYTETDTDPPISPPPVKHSPAGAGGYSDEFECFWAVYPKKTGKGDAFKVWKKNGHPSIERIVEVITAAKSSRKWLEDDGRFIPNPATWLNQKRWDDEYSAPRAKQEARLVL